VDNGCKILSNKLNSGIDYKIMRTRAR
jgi:hypothetical protein